MKLCVELEVQEEDYKEFIQEFDPFFDQWEDKEAVVNKIYELLDTISYNDLVDCLCVYEYVHIKI